MQDSAKANSALLARVFLVSVVYIALTKYPRRQNNNYVEKNGAMVGVPELATRFADPLLSAAVVVLLVRAD